jgi:hypothetical protein
LSSSQIEITAIFQDQASAGLNTLQTSLSATASSANQAGTSFNPLNTSMGATGTAATQANTGISPLSGALGTTATSASSANTAVAPLTGALGGAGTAAKSADQSLSPLGTTFGTVAKGGLDTTNTMQPLSGVMEKTGTSAGGLGTALKSNALSMSIVGAGVVGLVTSFSALESAHLRVERSDNMVAQAHLNVQKAQEAYNAAVQKFGPNSQQAIDALAKLTLAHNKEATQVEKNTLIHTQYGEQLGQFATQIAPQVITVGGGIVQMLSGMGISFSDITGVLGSFKTEIRDAFISFSGSLLGITPGLTNVGTAAEQATVKVRLMGLAMAAIPFAVGAAAATGFVIAIQAIYTHTTAVHDFFNQLGSDVQTVIPKAKQSFVEMGAAITDTARFFQIGLDRISNSLGITNVNQDITKEKMSELMTQVKETGSTIVAKFDEVTKSYIATGAAAGKSIDDMIALYKKNEDAAAINTAATNSDALITAAAWQSMQKAVNTAVSNIKFSFDSLITDMAGQVQKFTGIVPSIAQTFGSMGTTVIGGLSAIDAAFKNMKDESITSMEGVGAAVKKELEGMKTQMVSAGGVIKDEYFNAWKDVTALLANPTPAALAKVAADMLRLDVAVKNNEGSLKAAETGYISFGNQVVDMSTGKVVPAIAAIGNGLDAMIPKINTVVAGSKGFIQFGSYSVDAATGQMKLGSAVADTASAYQASLGPLGAIVTGMGASRTATTGTISEYDKLSGTMVDKVVPATKTLGTGVQNVGGALGDLQNKVNGVNDPLSSMATAGTKASTVMSTFGNQVKQTSKDTADLINSIVNGTEKTDAFNLGYTKAKQALVQFGVDTLQAKGDLTFLNEALANGSLQIANYNRGLIDGGLKYADFIAKTAQAIGSEESYSNSLKSGVAGLGFYATGLEATDKNLETFKAATMGSIPAMADLKKSVTELADSFFKLGDEVSNSLGQALEKGKKEFKTAMKDLEKSTGIKFDPEMKLALTESAAMSAAIDTGKKDVGVLVSAISGGLSGPEVGIAAAGMMDSIRQKFAKAGPQVLDEVQHMIDGVVAIANTPGPPQLPMIQSFMTSFNKLNMSTLETETILGGMKPAAEALAVSLLKPSISAIATANAFKLMGDKVDASGKVFDSTGKILLGVINNVTGQFQPATSAVSKYTTGVAAAADINKGFARGIDDAAGSLNTLTTFITTKFIPALTKSLSGGVNIATAAVNTAFKTMQDDVGGDLGLILNGINQFVTMMVTTMQKGVNTTTAAVNTAFKTMQNDVGGDLGFILNGINTFVTTMVSTMSKGVNTATAAVNTAFKTMQNDIGGDLGTILKGIGLFDTNMVAAFTKGMKDANTAMTTGLNTMKTNVDRVMGTIVSSIETSIGKAKTAIDGLKLAIASIPLTHNTNITAVWQGQSAVNQAINALNSVHDKTVTLTTINRTVNQTVFAAGGFHGVVSGATPFMVGEAGPEQVDITPAGQSAGGSNAHAPGGRQTPIIVNIQESNQPIIIKMDSREVGRGVKKNIFTLSSGGT